MLLTVLDGLGASKTIIVAGQETLVDASDTIVATGVAQNMLLANTARSGWSMQNLGANDMWVNDAGTATAGAGSYKVPAGGSFPPAGHPVVTGAVQILGTIGQAYTAKEW